MEGRVEAYMHIGARIGVLVEVHCQSDFAARTKEFRRLTKDLAMQVVANPNTEFVTIAHIPAQQYAELLTQQQGREDLENKPPLLRERIVQGRMEKFFQERVLFEQSFIRDPSVTVGDWVRLQSEVLGEKLTVERFTRYALGGSQSHGEDEPEGEVPSGLTPMPSGIPGSEAAVHKA
ncbi:MAG: elongation factor Ts [Anaerolineae bacterium]|nr:elongation factor Ts [Gloeobacterales cyanobacterium ES-bin-313]